MIDPSLWASVPYGNRTALLDFYGEHGLWHRALAETTFRLNGVNYRTYPLGDGGGPAWLRAHQAEHRNASEALGLAPPPDLESYDFSSRESFASWMFIHAQEHRLLRAAAGLA